MKKSSMVKDLKTLFLMCMKASPSYLLKFVTICLSQAFVMVLVTKWTQDFFDYVATTNKDLKAILLSLCMVSIGLFMQQLLNGVLNFMGWHLEIKVQKKMLFNFHNKVKRFSLIDFENYDTLNEICKAENGAKRTMDVAGTALMLLTFYIPYFLFMSLYLYSINHFLVFVLLLIFIPNFVTHIIRKKVFEKLEDTVTPLRRKIKCFQEYIVDKEIRHLGAYYFFRKAIVSNIEILGKKINKAEKDIYKWEFVMNMCTILGYMGILMLLVYLFLNRKIGVGAFSAIFSAIDIMYSLMQEIVCFHFGNLFENISIVSNFIHFMQAEKDEKRKVDKEFDIDEGIIVDNVFFDYPNASDSTLKNVSFRIKRGEKIAIVGENGAGKSTLAKLLTGLYLPSQGKVKIGGLDSAEMQQLIYRYISAVFQDYQRYKLTLRDNIWISDFASKNHEKIDSLAIKMLGERKVNSELSDMILGRDFGGIDLSGGQWQRIAIARGLFRTHQIIILDEPTAAIDPLEENYIYHAFREIAADKTSVIVTHRLGVAQIADRIMVLKAGEIKEEGTHKELMDKKGIYFNMYKEQAKWYS